MAKKKRIIRQRSTLLIVGEGATEEAFLKYLRSLYCADRQGPKVTIKNAYGKGPENILQVAIRELRRAAEYDRVAVLMDTDIPWTAQLRRQAKEHSIQLLGCSPCIEGLLLRLLDKKVPDSSTACKKELARYLTTPLTDPAGYEQWCTQDLLRQKLGVSELQELLAVFVCDKSVVYC